MSQALSPLQGAKPQAQARAHLWRYLFAGSYFGFVLVKAEVLSWYRIQEMFRFQSPYMYLVIGSAVLVGMLSLGLLRRAQVRSLTGEVVRLEPKPSGYKHTLLGGIIFGLGWGLLGACPGPIMALFGAGSTVMVVVFLSALAGTWAYAALKKILPHGP